MRSPLAQLYARLHGDSVEEACAAAREVGASGRPAVVVSACLLGVRCRYDGGDKRDDAAVERAAAGAQIVPLCPEVLARFGVPRPPIVLDGERALADGGRDVSAQLEAGAALADQLSELSGATRALLKQRSPSCGTRKVHTPNGLVDGEGRFARRLRRRGLDVRGEED